MSITLKSFAAAVPAVLPVSAALVPAPAELLPDQTFSTPFVVRASGDAERLDQLYGFMRNLHASAGARPDWDDDCTAALQLLKTQRGDAPIDPDVEKFVREELATKTTE